MIDDPAQRLREIDWNALEGLGPIVRRAAAEVLAGKSCEREIDRLLREHPDFTSAQRTAVVEAIFGVGLWRRRLVANLQIEWTDESATDRLPAHAAELLASLLRDLGGVDGARALSLSGAAAIPPCATALSPAERCSFPDWLWEIFAREVPSADDREAQELAAALCLPGPIFLRANRLLIDRSELAAALAREGIETAPCKFAPDGLRVLSHRPNLWASPALRSGRFEVQDEGSQLLGELLELKAGESALDVCAGAGGKSLQLAAAGAEKIVCTDPDLSRLQRLRARAKRANATRIEVVESIAPDAQFDRVLVDAPCSELGALRRGPDVRFRIDRRSIETLPELQQQILQSAAKHVRPGGRLVYATCTLRREENEAVAIAFEQAWSGFARIRPCASSLDESFFRAGFFKCLPHLHGTDGFFAASWIRENI